VIGVRCLVSQHGWVANTCKNYHLIDFGTIRSQVSCLEIECNDILERDAIKIYIQQRIKLVNLKLERFIGYL